MLVTPDGWRGNFFNTWTRTASQFEALPILQLPSKAWHGTHQLRAGADVTRRSYSGTSDSHPVDLLRADGSLVQRIDFQKGGSLDGKDTEVSEFVQGDWSLNDHLALDWACAYRVNPWVDRLPSRPVPGWPIHRAQARRPSSAQGGTLL